MSQANWFDLWGVLDHNGAFEDTTCAIKVYEADLLDRSVSYGAQICRLWIRHLACHDTLQDYSKERLAADLSVDASTIGRWIRELIDAGRLDEFHSTWLTDSHSGHVYFIQAASGGPIKIGRAIDIDRRLVQLQTASPEPLIVLAVIENGGHAKERELHKQFAEYRLQGEWFMPCEELISFISQITES